MSCAADAWRDRVAPDADAVESARIRSAMEPPAGASSTDSPLFFFLSSASIAAFIVKNLRKNFSAEGTESAAESTTFTAA